jgi:hypothetical protein
MKNENYINIIFIITGIILISSFIKVYEGMTTEVTYVQSSIDNRKYLVRNLHNKKSAADNLALLRQKLKRFVAHIYKEHPSDKTKRLLRKYRPDNITESTDTSKYTSYNINKGQKIVMCIRQRDEHEELIDMNTLFFVALHELTHIMTVSVGHKQEFWDNFKFILKFAIDNKYYEYVPYHKTPVKYCGTMITDTPHKL